jgi:hypothetical protein
MGKRRVYREFWWEEMMERDHLEHLGLDGRMDNIEMDLQEFGWGGMDWIDLARGSDRLRTYVNLVKNI